MTTNEPNLSAIRVVEDRTAGSRCDEGFLRLRRLRLQNVYDDGERSRVYDCDIVSRRHVDAVAIVLYDRKGEGGRLRVALRTGVRPPVYLRREKHLPHEERERTLLAEIVAGVLEKVDAEDGGIERRAAIECREEAGYDPTPDAVQTLGASLFPSPGITDEKVFFRAVETDLDVAGPRDGDGSVMEEAGEVIVLPLRDAIAQCRDGTIPDMKTEVALLRIADAVGYIHTLDRFVSDLPEAFRTPKT